MRNSFLILVVLMICLRSGSAEAGTTGRPSLFRLDDASAPPPIRPGAELKYRAVGEDRIPGQYIVVLSDDVLPSQVTSVARDLGLSHQFSPGKVWQDAIKGFFAEMTETRARTLSNSPLVKYVEQNAQWHTSATTQQTNINPVTCDPTVTTCTGAGIVTDNRLWHLDRTDQNYPDSTNSYSYCTDGTGVTVYVVDNGVNKYHQEFGGRVTPGYNATGDATTNDHMPADDPCLGFILPAGNSSQEITNYGAELGIISHGTAVASVLGGRRVGIAKNVTIVPVKTSRCDLYSSRLRLSNHFYSENKTIFRSQNGVGFDALYRCITPGGGTTAVADPGGWSITPGALVVDGGVTWEVLSPSVYSNFQTTNMIIDGLNWILSSGNTGPKSYAIITMSIYRRWDDINGTNGSIDGAVRSLLANNLTVVASANNQNGSACDTSPSRLSQNNPDPNIASDVITAGGSMIINRPWNVNLNESPAIPYGATEADGGGTKGPEPSYDATKAVRDGRWICGAGDTDTCSNLTSTSTADPTGSPLSYYGFVGGSNAGPCVTLFAPAKNLFLATTTGSGTDYRDPRIRGLASGTSWSAPIVAGFAARILQNNPTYTPTQVRAALLNNCVSTLDASTLNTYTYQGTPITGTPNKLLRLGDVNITQQPVSQTASPSDTPTLSVQASGTSTVSYQWYRVNSGFDLVSWHNGAHYDTGGVGAVASSSTKIIGATSSTYQAPPSSVTTGYWARATNSCGSADTDIAVMTIVTCIAPSIPGQPSSTTIVTGQTATLSVTASGTATLSYQWYTGNSGNTSSPVGGGIGASVTVSPASTTSYWVRVTNSCGSADSITVTVTVTTNPPSAATLLYRVTPCRIIDTRDPNGPQGGPALMSGGTRNINVAGVCGIPTGVVAISINLAVVTPSAGGFLTLFTGPANAPLPLASTINFQTNRTLANNAIVRVGSDSINVYDGGPNLHLVIDVNGYFK